MKMGMKAILLVWGIIKDVKGVITPSSPYLGLRISNTSNYRKYEVENTA